jgi:hypothetical protein
VGLPTMLQVVAATPAVIPEGSEPALTENV